MMDDEYKESVYIDNLITHFYKNHNDAHCKKLFSQYMGFVVHECVDRAVNVPNLDLDTCNFMFVTPRIFGYKMTESEVHSIFTEAGLLINTNQKVTLMNDLDVHIEDIQDNLEIGKLRVCVFCTLYLLSDLSMHNTVDSFFSGTFIDRDLILPGPNNKIKPVNCRTLPSLPNTIDVGPLYESVQDYMADKIDTSTDIIERCLYAVLLCLKV
jgi:predicted phosphatase